MVQTEILTEEQIVEHYNRLYDLQKECEDKWGEDIDDECAYMDFIDSTEELDSFYDEHSLIIDNSTSKNN
jgi:hypothetical protein